MKQRSLTTQMPLPGISCEMRTPEFWAGRIKEPDRILLSAEQIAAMNRSLVVAGLTEDPAGFGDVCDGVLLRNALEAELEKFGEKEYYLSDGSHVPAAFWESIRKDMRLENIPDTSAVRFGLTRNYCDQRVLPTMALATAKPGDIDFDELQNSSFDPGVPLAVLHESGEWCFVVSPSSRGWIPTKDIAFCGREQMAAYMKGRNGVIISRKADIFLDAGMKRHYAYGRMGSRFPLVRQEGDVAVILLPDSEAYVRKADINEGFLPFTRRNVLSQAFLMLDAPYKWGGNHCEQDCSGFIQQVFAVFGLELPRNSIDQAKSGADVRSLAEAGPGTTLLGMPGHIMLFLGMIDGEPYAIHDVWAYRVPSADGDVPCVIGRVAVTGLRLGQGSRKGSWMERIDRIRDLAR